MPEGLTDEEWDAWYENPPKEYELLVAGDKWLRIPATEQALKEAGFPVEGGRDE